MCIFCGGQCGGLGEFLISLGLPFLALYLSRIKSSLAKIKQRFFPLGSNVARDKVNVRSAKFCGELVSTTHQQTWPVGFTSRLQKPVSIPFTLTKLNNRAMPEEQEDLRGVSGWLLLFCINLTIFTPSSCLYEANCTLDLFNST